MIKFLIQRPIAVFMAFTACFILGVITYLNITISLLPDMAIPEMSVHVSAKDFSARELENTVVSTVRRQLMQVGQLRDIRSETRDGNGVIYLYFEYGTDTELAFIALEADVVKSTDAGITLYRVFLGPFDTAREANELQQRLTSNGFDAMVIKNK